MRGQAPSNYVIGTVSPETNAWLELCRARGAFQGWIGDYIVYQKDGITYGYLSTNKTTEPDYTGTEGGLYVFAGREPFPEYARRW